MLHSFLKLSLRNLFRKNRLFTLINITGLSIGLGCLLLICLYIHNEYSFDKYHKNADRIYRIVLDFTSEGNTINWAKTSAPIGHYLFGSYPEIEQVVRIRKNPGTDLLSHENIHFYEENIFFADSTLLNVFDFKLKTGNPLFALNSPNSIILTEALAKKYFKDKNPLGQTLRFNNLLDLKVTGVLERMRPNSHFIADGFITFSSLKEILGEQRLSHWGQFDHYTYTLLTKGSSAKQVEAKFPELLKKNAPEWVSEKEKLFLQPLTSIHLQSHRKDEITPNSKESYSYVLGTIALFILLMALVNFVNLSTATQLSRLRETSIQKVLGANPSHLIRYFLIESVVLCVISLSIAIMLSWLLLPYFNVTTGKEIVIDDAKRFLFPFLILSLVIALVASVAPVVQSWKSNILRAKYFQTSKSTVRSLLITFQLSISIILIIATFIVSSQSNFLSSSRLGFKSHNVITIPIKDRSQNQRYSTIVNEVKALPGIKNVSYSSSSPGSNNALTYTYTISGSESGEQPLPTFLVDENFLDVYDIEIISGRSLNPVVQDTLSEVLVNEAAIKQLGLTAPLGQIVTGKVKGKIIGVVKNFNSGSLHSSVEPVIMYAFTPTYRFVSVKLNQGEVQQGISSLERSWPELYPGYPLEYSFLDDQIEQLYASEYQLSKAYNAFSVVAIIIAGIGLIGLTTYIMTRKQKEISIRKVFGGSTGQIVNWIYSGYFKLFLIAILLSWTFTYYWMNRWLNEFAYKIDLSFKHFMLPSLIMIFILLLTTGLQTIKASRTNPINSLREE